VLGRKERVRSRLHPREATMKIHSLLLLAALGCGDDKPHDTGEPDPSTVDADGDGSFAADDCDDSDPDIHPGGVEICDEVDNDCDGEVDEGVTEAWWADLDGDGYGDPAVAKEACEAPDGYVADATDCDDSSDEDHPGAAERCDGLDNDCDGSIDEALTELWYADSDGDGYGDPWSTLESCDPGSGWVAIGDDCDDADAAIHPAATELCDEADNDCDGSVDEDDAADAATWYLDGDGDGFGDAAATAEACSAPSGYVGRADDCDDGEAAVSPVATELCDGVDNDCDGVTDEDDAADAATWYADGDGDGYGDPDASRAACSAPTGHVADDGDCDDGDATLNPDTIWYLDHDADGFGDPGFTTRACERPSGFVADATDCDDMAADNNPAATEICDGDDDDCDGSIDEDDAADAGTWYADTDGDGYGDPTSSRIGCSAPSGHVADDGDCDDGDANLNPDTYWYLDRDGDSYGDPGFSLQACEQPTGFVSDATDCDDVDAGNHPAATEICDGVDNDCDGSTDEAGALGLTDWYADSDGDGYGDPAMVEAACSAPGGHVADGTDCDDASSDVHPGADERCNGADDDCDGTIDEDDAIDASTWYADADGDGYGDPGASETACSAPSGTTADSSDCDDADANNHPAGTELCDGEDNDCDGTIDEDDAIDASTWYLDADGDGAGTADDSLVSCDQPTSYVDNDDDCYDDDPSTIECVVYGLDASNPGITCADILDFDASYLDGFYWIDPDADADPSDSFEVYCDMTSDGGGWTLLSWTGDSTVSPYGVPYPGLDECGSLACSRGSTASAATLTEVIQRSLELGAGYSPGSIASYQNLEDYSDAGLYSFGSLSAFYLDVSSTGSCSGLTTGTFFSISGSSSYDGQTIYLAQSFRYTSSYSDFDESSQYIWSIAPDSYCSGNGSAPGIWWGNWSTSEHEYGPLSGSATGARSFWAR
jgi:hypothetical protein